MAETKKVRITRNQNYHQSAINGLLNELGVSLSMSDEQGRQVTVMTQDQIEKFRMRAGAHTLEVDEPEQPEPEPADAKPDLEHRVSLLESQVIELQLACADLEGLLKAYRQFQAEEQLEPTPILG